MKTKLLYLFLLLSLIFTFCKYEKPDSQKFSNFFNSVEITELNKILNYFDEKAKNKCSSGDIKECYREFCESILKDFKNGNASFDTIGISTDISSRFSQNIWSTNKGIKRDISGNITEKLYCEFNFHGKYIEFLKYYSEKNDLIKNYYDTIIQVRGMGPTSITLMLNCDKIDFGDENIRLIYAIHCISYSCNYL